MAEKSGLYYHIPFCRNKCPYCDFFSTKYCESAAREYIEELKEKAVEYDGEFDTIYFGGGTPSILPAEYICDIIDFSKEHFVIDDDCEITVECNPSKDMSEDFLEYARHGVNRISLGMQSAVDKERFALGRTAGKEQVQKAIDDAKNAGISNISLDIMLGTPKQTLDSLDETFDFAAKADITHISAYMLKIESGTKFFELKDKLSLPDEETTAEMYLKTVRTLNDLGLKQYEISNFAKSDCESRHNTKYWRLVPYLGIGKSAHSFWGGKRFYYDKDFNKIPDGDGGDEEERIMLGLRLTEGVDKSLIKKDITPYIKAGMMKISRNKVALTPKGMLVSNYIISEII